MSYENNILAGDAKGKLQVWSKNTLAKAYQIHDGALDALWADANK
jgi:hypothetical protein